MSNGGTCGENKPSEATPPNGNDAVPVPSKIKKNTNSTSATHKKIHVEKVVKQTCDTSFLHRYC